MTINNLSWDTEFFGFGVSQIRCESDIDLTKILDKAFMQGSELIYVFSKKSIKNSSLKTHNGTLVDTKITFSKKIGKNKSNFSIESVLPYDSRMGDEKIHYLSYLSGRYSRFKLDDSIPPDKFYHLYSLWVINSLNKSIASEVLVYLHQNEILGFVTIGIEKLVGTIGLISVDPRAQREGIGHKLLLCTEQYLKSQGISKLMVSTQKLNRGAVKFYLKNSFSEVERIKIYHFWNK